MSTRIGNSTLVSELERYMTYNRGVVNEKYLQISSGKQYLKRSDDPVTTYEIANIEARNQRSDQWSDNIKKAQSWEAATESRLDNILSAMQRLKELLVEANAGTYTPNDLKNIGIEVNQTIDSLVSELNADFAGTPMFAGAGIRPDGHAGHWNQATNGTSPVAGDFGMPAAGGNDWEDLTQVEYNNWYSAVCQGAAGSVTGTTASSITCGAKDWSAYDLTGATIKITGGTGAGQELTIASNTANTINVQPDWTTVPDGTSTFEIVNYSPGWINSTGRTFEATYDDQGNMLTVTYNGSKNKRNIQVSDFKTTSDYGTTGDELINYKNLETNPSPPPDWVTVDVNLFDSIIALRDELAEGKMPADTFAKRAEAGLDNVISKVVQNAVSQNKLDLLDQNITISQTSGENWLADISDIDVAKAVTDLNEMEAALQATLQMVPRMNKMRIVDYI